MKLRNDRYFTVSISIENLSLSFGSVHALRNVDVVVPKGSLTALLGPSGCGKTTLLRAIAGLETPDRGRITIAGKDVADVPLARRNVGFVFQHYALFPHLTVAENVAFALRVRRRARAESDARVAELLALVQLEGYAKRRPHELSGGQRQRVALARALAAEPDVLLLDEPFGALDLHVRRDLRRRLRELHERTHVTTLIVTHDSDEAMEIADDLVIMRDGVVQQQGAPHELYRAPINAFVMRFLGDVSIFSDANEPRYARPSEVRVGRDRFGDARPATVSAVRVLGARTRLELVLDDGSEVLADLDDSAAESLAPRPRSIVYVEPQRTHVFQGAPAFS